MTRQTKNLRLRHTLKGHTGPISAVAFSPDGLSIGSASFDRTLRVWDIASESYRALIGHSNPVLDLTWSPDSTQLASCGEDRTVRVWDSGSGKALQTLKGNAGAVQCVAWSPNGKFLASGSDDGEIRVWNAKTGAMLRTVEGRSKVLSLSWSLDSRLLTSGTEDAELRLWDVAHGDVAEVLSDHTQPIQTVAWSPDGGTLASGAGPGDAAIRIWDANSGMLTHTLEGHFGGVSSVHFSHDGRLLASKSTDDTIRLWNTDTGAVVATLPEPTSESRPSELAFHPSLPLLATLGESDRELRLWELDTDRLLAGSDETPARYTSAKVVLVGESNVGKSSLAMRLAEDRYPTDDEHGTTHGMRVWTLDPAKLNPDIQPEPGQRREVALWDFGGLAEYQLVHQLFLDDTSQALFVFDPTRGATGFQEVEDWNERFEKQLGDRKPTKLLIGSKMDRPGSLVDKVALRNLMDTCGFSGYYATSARSDRGVNALREAIAETIDWDRLGKTSRPKLFQGIHDEIEKRRKAGDIVLLLSDLEATVSQSYPSISNGPAVSAVADQLSAQGVIVETHLASGERALVLQLSVIERYAGALIALARGNSRGVPALEERQLGSPGLALPGVGDKERIRPRIQERIIVECVVELLLEHGLCFRHEGLLIFPSLLGQRAGEESPEPRFPVSLYYDFTGAVDNIYASLIAWLVIVKDFGTVRIWRDHAVFERPGQGLCGLRKSEQRPTMARLDIYFDDQAPAATRNLFIRFIENHLMRAGVEVTEHLEIFCSSCHYQLPEEAVRERLSRRETDIGCPMCDVRVDLSGFSERMRRAPELEGQIVALRTLVEKRLGKIVETVKRQMGDNDIGPPDAAPIRILHLSDLHFDAEEQADIHIQTLLADLRNADEGLGIDHIDYLVVSGDLSRRAAPEGFGRAREFLSGLLTALGGSAHRLIVVPGNHDASWLESVYRYQPHRTVDARKLESGKYVEERRGYLIRNEAAYPERFRNFSDSLYHPLIQAPYPNSFADQGIPFFFADTGIQFLAFNSSWEIDEWFLNRSSIQPQALARGLSKADQQISSLNSETSVLRIAVWHHPVMGTESMAETAFLDQLAKANVRLLLHGHVSDTRRNLIGYRHRSGIHVVAAGAAGSSRHSEFALRLYNLLEIDRDHASIKVHTRHMSRRGGAWKGWAEWPAEEPSTRRTFYNIRFDDTQLDESTSFDVFLCHDPADAEAAMDIAVELEERGLRPWFAKWEVPPGRPWEHVLRQKIDKIRSIAVLVGQGDSPFENSHLDLVRSFVEKGLPVIPVVLKGRSRRPKMPLALRALRWVDFRRGDPDSSIEELVWGITGERDREESVPVEVEDHRKFLRRIKLTDVRCIAEIELSFVGEDFETRSWTTLLGKNGRGKTTILRSIALMTSGSEALPTLLGDRPEEWIRLKQPFCLIEADLIRPDGTLCSVELKIERGDKLADILMRKPLREVDRAIGKDPTSFFTVAYGCTRRQNTQRRSPGSSGKKSAESQRAECVSTLFEPSASLYPLQKFALDLDYDQPRLGKRIVADALQDLLPDVEFSRIAKDQRDLLFKADDVELPLSFLSDGYQVVIAWLGDLLYRVMQVAPKHKTPLEMHGLLLIDEIELHMHPTWQREFRQFVADKLPNFQIVTTTHSPLTAQQSGQGELFTVRSRAHVVTEARYPTAEGGLEIVPFEGDPRLLLLKRILTSEAFDLPTTESRHVQQKRQRFIHLRDLRSRNDDQEDELNNLRNLLEEVPDDVESSSQFEEEHSKLLDRIARALETDL